MQSNKRKETPTAEDDVGAAVGSTVQPRGGRDGVISHERKSKRMKKKGMRADAGIQLCRAYMKGTCEKLNDCKFSHDLEAYLRTKQPPLPGQCIFQQGNVECPYGITCRFSHDKTIPCEDNAVALPSIQSQPLQNNLSFEIRDQLRKRTYDFTPANNILAKHGIIHKPIEEDTAIDIPLRSNEKMTVNFSGKLYLAPLTTVGNLPFRRMCIDYGADVTCSEMALATNLLQGRQTEWALLKRHPSESLFGIQLCGGYADALVRTAQLIEDHCSFDFIDINLGCPIDAICQRSAGASLLVKPNRIQTLSKAMSDFMHHPLTLKMRKGYHDDKDVVHEFIPSVKDWGVSAVTLHGRTRAQRYTKQSDWAYIYSCAKVKSPGLQFIGNGDVFSFTEWEERMEASEGSLDTCMIGRAALIKPWIFTEIKERRHWDISASERLEMLKVFASRGLEHWGSDQRGVETTRRFLLEWLSFLHRYIPVGLLDVVPQHVHTRPTTSIGRNELETLFMSNKAQDWVSISEMLLGRTPSGFSFCPRYKSNAYPDEPIKQ